MHTQVGGGFSGNLRREPKPPDERRFLTGLVPEADLECRICAKPARELALVRLGAAAKPKAGVDTGSGRAQGHRVVTNQNDILKDLRARTAKAVARYWQTRSAQSHIKTPADDLSVERFARLLVAHVAAFV